MGSAGGMAPDDTVEAATGLEALKQARARPDLMDLSMPVVTGDEAMA